MTAAATSSAEQAMARVVTYNVLSSHLADPGYFTHCDAENLDADVRLGRVMAKLDAETARRAVVGLQEVSMSWAGPLHAYFAAKGYHFVVSLYGKPFNNYMGVGLAVPLDAYEVTTSDISRLSDTVKFPQVKKKDKDFGILNPVVNVLKMPVSIWRKLTDYRPPSDEWQTARGRFNSILYATLTCKKTNAKFGVCTYHMPCMFRTAADRRVMTIHAGIAAQYALNQSAGLPVVLMGDFNLKPGDAGHTLITTGDLDESHEAYPVMPEGYKGEPFNVKPAKKMESAYARVNGEEPNFTNNAQIKDDEPFIDTLDYIFVTDDIDVVEVLELPHRDDVKGPFPAETEPSDHIMLAATIRFGGSSR
jgi:endonuclease/exonuclease/phosphatase family metal-dependent hydrolase